MKRLHVHIKVKDIDSAIPFYQAMFGQAPSKKEADYAKWMLDDPHANVSLSTHGATPGIDHAGIQVETSEELLEISDRMQAAKLSIRPEENTTCCYAQSDKRWAHDGQGATWELFHSFADSDTYGAEPDRELNKQPSSNASACCAP